MKKLNYEKPQLEVVEVDARDIITSSDCTTQMVGCSGLDSPCDLD